MESWMLSAVISLVGLIAMLAVGKYKTDQNQKEINSEKVSREAIGKKLDKAVEELAVYKVKLATAPSMEDVRKEFVSKEMFRQFEKHIDSQFENVRKPLEKMLDNQDALLKEIRGSKNV